MDDPCANVRKFAIECVAELKVDKSDPMFDETNYAMLAEMIISRLILYLDDPYIKIRPILIGRRELSYLKYFLIKKFLHFHRNFNETRKGTSDCFSKRN